jgi:hypothetical protein
MNQDALDFLPIPCLHGEIKFQHSFPKKLPCRKIDVPNQVFPLCQVLQFGVYGSNPKHQGV